MRHCPLHKYMYVIMFITYYLCGNKSECLSYGQLLEVEGPTMRILVLQLWQNIRRPIHYLQVLQLQGLRYDQDKLFFVPPLPVVRDLLKKNGRIIHKLFE